MKRKNNVERNRAQTERLKEPFSVCLKLLAYIPFSDWKFSLIILFFDKLHESSLEFWCLVKNMSETIVSLMASHADAQRRQRQMDAPEIFDLYLHAIFTSVEPQKWYRVVSSMFAPFKMGYSFELWPQLSFSFS